MPAFICKERASIKEQLSSACTGLNLYIYIYIYKIIYIYRGLTLYAQQTILLVAIMKYVITVDF